MNKSEELAKLLGIEPIKKDCPHRGCRNHITHPCEVCNNRRFINIYPDFTKPYNFVKLLEYLIEVTGIRFTKEMTTIGLGIGDDFQSALLDYLIQLSNGKGEYQIQYKRVKQQAQQVNWEW